MLELEQEQVCEGDLEAGKLPREVELILSALETGQHTKDERREHPRSRYRTKGKLRLFSDPPRSDPWTVYTRDVNARGMGFITPHRLPLGYGGQIDLPHPDGGVMTIHCTLLRCRVAAPGWFEGAVYFNRQQPEFEFEADGRE
jgi:hypothetical protein